ncbi:ACP phosphodiesterase [Bizionia paragorgiae]|uniref:Acyl carrier protein phosphodiesterase n=1 Tax=Bizionia paragorgiae TaxID=283786 RepID=A0A1H3XJB7_BIZPA|nr:acyl carrier protein phosphodiesterase [Bizionia paragorgiae]SDZ99350.1 Acyl carrier protein phosphodiesterase [Bizionia paragorgiae]
MNFLAHIYLSGDNEGVIIGNFIADGIRGKKYLDYPTDIKTGILLHRQIDTFTDAHPTVRLSTKKLHKKYGHYSGIIVDILYDHFLAKNWSRYSNVPLNEYVANFYKLLQNNYDILPKRITNMMPYMIADNWILNYATIEGISQTLEGMNRRTKNKAQMNLAVHDLIEYYDEFEAEFTSFFEDLILFSKEQLKLIQE